MHPLQAFFLLEGAFGLIGSQVGTGRCLSSSVRSDSASMRGVDGEDDERAQRTAFFLSESVFLRLIFRRGTDPLGRTDVAGFCAIIVFDSVVDERMINPAEMSSFGRKAWNVDGRERRWSVPRGERPDNIWLRKEPSFGSSPS